MFTVVLAAAVALTWHKRLPTGTYVAVTTLAYAPARFAMDFLRIRGSEGADLRYSGLTPAQWACIALFAYGIYTLTTVLVPRMNRATHAR
jgi:phosphatidylglycerol:prolipoprotein diacylglycerol transferase